ncbi:hypothetical protein LINGRAHAP2_LOCUS28855 [Linum grandiflorum]
MKLAREKHRSSRIKLCGSIELAIRVSILLLLLSTFVILLLFLLEIPNGYSSRYLTRTGSALLPWIRSSKWK